MKSFYFGKKGTREITQVTNNKDPNFFYIKPYKDKVFFSLFPAFSLYLYEFNINVNSFATCALWSWLKKSESFREGQGHGYPNRVILFVGLKTLY